MPLIIAVVNHIGRREMTSIPFDLSASGITQWVRRLACGALLLLGACGGASSPSTDAQRFAARIAEHATGSAAETGTAFGAGRATRLSATDGATLSAEQWFVWVEQQYSALFPSGPATETAVHEGVTYTLRHYPATGNYLGVVADGRVYALGDFTAQRIQAYGRLSYYTCLVDPSVCSPLPALRQIWAWAGTLQCDSTPIQQPLQALRQRLEDAGVQVKSATCGSGPPGFGTCAACGCPELLILVFDVPAEQLPLAFGLDLAPYTEGVDGVTKSVTTNQVLPSCDR